MATTSVGEPETPADLYLVGSVGLPNGAVGNFAGELITCVGIDIQSARGAPANECVRINLGAYRDPAAALDRALDAICHVAPLFIGRGQQFSIRHDVENAAVVLAVVPRNSGRADRHGSHRTDPHWFEQWGFEARGPTANRPRAAHSFCTFQHRDADNLATATSLDATMALAEWQTGKRDFEAQLAAVDAIMSEPQQVPA